MIKNMIKNGAAITVFLLFAPTAFAQSSVPDLCKWQDRFSQEIAENRPTAELEKYKACGARYWAAEKQKHDYLMKEIADGEKKRREVEKVEEWALRNRLARPTAVIGMSKDQVVNETSWGVPESVNRTVTANGVDEQWVYRTAPHHGDYLYFHDDVLVTMQEKK
jgi:hypothetical protein